MHWIVQWRPYARHKRCNILLFFILSKPLMCAISPFTAIIHKTSTSATKLDDCHSHKHRGWREYVCISIYWTKHVRMLKCAWMCIVNTITLQLGSYILQIFARSIFFFCSDLFIPNTIEVEETGAIAKMWLSVDFVCGNFSFCRLKQMLLLPP